MEKESRTKEVKAIPKVQPVAVQPKPVQAPKKPETKSAYICKTNIKCNGFKYNVGDEFPGDAIKVKNEIIERLKENGSI